MTPIKFDRTQETLTLIDTSRQAVERVLEIRRDPLTGNTSRILVDPGRPFEVPDYSAAAARSSGANCPFCPDNLHKLTPSFPTRVVPAGKIEHGQVTVFPNLFPYTAHNGVVVLGPEHYTPLPDFSEQLLVEGFEAAQIYIASVREQAEGPLHTAINWNYLPASGGSILHPHLHVTLSHTASNYQRAMNEGGRAFKAQTGTDFLSSLCAAEQASGERWIGQLGPVRWLHAFAPSSHNDFIGVFEAKRISALRSADWQAMVRGLMALFATLTAQGLASFNLVLTESETLPLHLRLASRIAYGELQTSDINFFQMLHRDPLSIKKPEAVAALARSHWPAAA